MILGPRQLELQCFLPTNGSLYPPIISDGESKIFDAQTRKNETVFLNFSVKTIDAETLTKNLTDADAKPIVFAIKKNLLARVKLLNRKTGRRVL